VPTNYPWIPKRQCGRPYDAVDDVLRLDEVVQIVRPAAAIGDSKPGLTCSPTCSANPLDVVERFRRNVSQEDDIEITEVDAKFKRRRATEDVYLTLAEASLILTCLFVRELRGMFFDSQNARELTLVEDSVVVIC
jgi:hypothetical protein